MPTHLYKCVVCGNGTGCSADEHSLGSGASCYEDGIHIEFCSVRCFNTLLERMVERAAIAVEIYPKWAPILDKWVSIRRDGR